MIRIRLQIHITIENEKGDAHTGQAALISSQTDLSAYTAAYQLRLTVTNNNPASAFDIAQKLQGTKAYGVKSDGEPDELISNSVPVLVTSQYGDTYTSDKYIEIPQGATYTSIRFEYPAAACFTGQSEIHELSDSVYTDIVSTIRTNTHDALITLLASKSDPIVSSNNEYGTSTIAYTFVHKTGEAAKTVVVSPVKEYTYIKNDFKLKYDDIVRGREVNVTNGTELFSDDIVKTQVSYKQQKHGDSNAVKPYNPTIYYLVPDGLEPNQIGANANPMWSLIGVQRNYKPGYNLVIAKPKFVLIPDGSQSETSVTNTYTMDFRVTLRMDTAHKLIYSCLLIDNNEIGEKNNQQYGILQHNPLYSPWDDITVRGVNRLRCRTGLPIQDLVQSRYIPTGLSLRAKM